MNLIRRGLLFDAADYELVRAVDEARNASEPAVVPRKTDRALHPCGIRELAESRSSRLAENMLRVIDHGETGSAAAEERLAALQALRDEVLEGMNVPLAFNTARALLQLLKELVREDGHSMRRLQLAHDVRTAMLGNPLFIRKILRRYRLIEMPESWQPVTFDQHVHDANTKGRKSPTHLILDAWIKGIFQLQVIYYNYVPREAADELLRAAEILRLDVRIGVEFRTLFRGRFVELIWTPCGFSGAADFLRFLDRPRTGAFTRKCLKAAAYRRKTVLGILEEFNRHGLRKLNEAYDLDLLPVSPREFLAGVHYGQPSIEHIGELLAARVRAALDSEIRRLEQLPEPGKRELRRLRERRREKQELSGELLTGNYLKLEKWSLPPDDPAELPELNRCTPPELLDELRKVASGYRITLNLSNLHLESVIELLYDCRGDISTVEIFNLKDEIAGSRPDDAVINRLRHALNSGSVVKLKNLLHEALRRVETSDYPDRDRRLDKLRRILSDLPAFLSFYARVPLGVSIGSDSASRASRTLHGMGFAVIDTLPGHVRRSIRRGGIPELQRVPLDAEVFKLIRYAPPGERRSLRCRRRVEWHCSDPARAVGRDAADGGNMAALGGFAPPGGETPPRAPAASPVEYWNYLNCKLRIALKIVIGFLAAFLTFYFCAQQWWFLRWFGAAIWLGITALRNIIQLIVSGGGVRSSPLWKWNDFIPWERVADSLLYTGLSVPLLEYLVKTLLLNDCFGWNAENEPLLVFSGIALANGFYISFHNFLRAFPRAAIWGNWLRAPLSIPLALGINAAAGALMTLLHVPGVEAILQQWAAVTSKAASDIIGGIIEALADRAKNLAARERDFRTKLRELFNLTAKVELLVPESDLAALLKPHGSLLEFSGIKRNNLARAFYINALDMMYIWMRQPQGVAALRRMMARLSPAERLLVLRTQEMLNREKAITKLFLNGLVGKNFTRALAFYLHYRKSYLNELNEFDPIPLPRLRRRPVANREQKSGSTD